MKSHHFKYKLLQLTSLFFIFFIISSCGQLRVQPEIIGQWNSEKHKIIVRTQTNNMKFIFTADSAVTSITINQDKTVTGHIGSAVIEHGKIMTNWLLPVGMTGCAYTISCDLRGKIFENDPLIAKEVEFWVAPLKKNLSSELRYTNGMAVFPMASMIFFKKKD